MSSAYQMYPISTFFWIIWYTSFTADTSTGERVWFVRTEWISLKNMIPQEILLTLTPLRIVTVHTLVHEFIGRTFFASNILQILREWWEIDSWGIWDVEGIKISQYIHWNIAASFHLHLFFSPSITFARKLCWHRRISNAASCQPSTYFFLHEVINFLLFSRARITSHDYLTVYSPPHPPPQIYLPHLSSSLPLYPPCPDKWFLCTGCFNIGFISYFT